MPSLLCFSYQSKIIDTVYPVVEGNEGLVRALTRICIEATEAAEHGFQLIVLSDKNAGKDFVPVRYINFTPH